ncbi:3-hydroxyacyl-CoA dehydrogenase NAD-binding domain-containing protein [Desulfosporosinus sp. Sb-LF]|uniref:3-hydroxyacyl-CoA dehydrogenase family protein n=1 Tax=Desulfosporosinus sp. Sb-LF TaxID=2560027 RepID=UPI00107F19F1|nr:3-hydroxyacyl-CoA dehydrogenase NAD-binding domain-containing protein [Desulfosporosinus sp. Sb-LF]TGE33543.1 3-hydroxybutyryl-CoA dehydrogenase [Desulfosporosinus sp. Sb-LF]
MIKKIGVLGAGTMGGGTGIAHLAAMKGFEVVLYGAEQRFVESAIKNISRSLGRKIEMKKMTVNEKEAILKRITITTNMEDFASVDLVIEAIYDEIEIKKIALERLAKICSPDTIFGTNTSSKSMSTLTSATSRPDKVVGLRFSNPSRVMRKVEVIRGSDTSDETVNVASIAMQAMGKVPVVAQAKTVRAVEEGLGTSRNVDTLVRMGSCCVRWA